MAGLEETYLTQAGQLMAQRELTLRGRGYTSEVIQAGISRAYGIANDKTKHLSTTLKGPAFLETLAYELSFVERWVKKELTQTAPH